MPGAVQSVERAAAMLQLLAAEDEPLGLVQIAGALGLAKGTAHGLLKTLAEVGFVEREAATGRYLLSADLYRLGSPRLDLNELRAKALNWTDALAARTGEAARVAAYREGRAVLAHHVFGTDPDQETPRPGAGVPLHANALGKVLLAYDPGAARSLVGRTLDRFTENTQVDRVAVQRELATIRDVGWAAAMGEDRAGIGQIAAPVRDRGGFVVAAVGIEASIGRLCDDRSRPRTPLVTEVVRTARSISRELGHGRGDE